MITYLELENWKAHGLTRLEFSKGSNILLGQMGAGKSSILDAISFSLFGTFPSIKNRRVKVEDLIRNKPEQKRSARTKLGFHIDGIEYVVERSISLDGGAKASFSKNGAYVQSQPQRVTEEIEKVLKMDYDLFSRAVYSEQNKLDYFLELGSSDRKKQIDNLLGLDKFATAQENCVALINRIKNMVEDAEKSSKTFDITLLNSELSALIAEHLKIQSEKKELESSISKLNASKTTLEKDLSIAKQQNQKKVQLEKEIGELKSKLMLVDKEILTIQSSGIGPLTELDKKLKELDSGLSDLKKQSTSSSELLQKLQSSTGKVQKELADLEKNRKEESSILEKLKVSPIEKIRINLEKSTAELEQLDKDHAHASTMLQESQKSLDELSTHLGKCPICDSELTEDKRKSLISSKENAVKEFKPKMLLIAKSRSEKKEQITKFNSELNSMAVLEQRLKGFGDLDSLHKKATDEQSKLSADVKKGNEAIVKLNEQISTTSAEVAKLNSQRETAQRLVKYKSDKQAYETQAESKTKEATLITIDVSKLEKMQTEFTKINSDIAQKNAYLSANLSADKEKQKQVESKQSEVTKITAIFEDLKLKRASLDDLARFRNSLEETQSILRNRLVHSVNEVMSDIWPELYPYGDYTGIMLSPSETDYALQLRVVRNKEQNWESVNSIASGGERSIACMVMRVAFSLVLVPNLRWLILDEPTHNIDQEGLSKFVTLLNETLPKLIDQIFIITHDEKLKSVSNANIYMLSRAKAESGATVVESL